MTAIQPYIDAIEAKDLYTQGHSHHVKVVAEAVLDSLPSHIRSLVDRDDLLTAALLHDVGKIKTPDDVLNKTGALTDEEWRVMREHPSEGQKLLNNTPFSHLGDIVLYHHERMDGRGYYGLDGADIPFAARIIAVADTFSALRTYRIYRPAKNTDETLHIMNGATGAQLDAELTRHFFALSRAFFETLECNCPICVLRRKELEERIRQLELIRNEL